MKPLTLVKYDYDGMPKDWLKQNPVNQFPNTMIYIGEISNMPEHGYCQDIETGKGTILHIENLIELTEDEL